MFQNSKTLIVAMLFVVLSCITLLPGCTALQQEDLGSSLTELLKDPVKLAEFLKQWKDILGLIKSFEEVMTVDTGVALLDRMQAEITRFQAEQIEIFTTAQLLDMRSSMLNLGQIPQDLVIWANNFNMASQGLVYRDKNGVLAILPKGTSRVSAKQQAMANAENAIELFNLDNFDGHLKFAVNDKLSRERIYAAINALEYMARYDAQTHAEKTLRKNSLKTLMNFVQVTTPNSTMASELKNMEPLVSQQQPPRRAIETVVEYARDVADEMLSPVK